MHAIALYYPWMHFQDDNWLKLALLTWDKVVRVRPRDVDDRDGELVRQVRAETDLLLEIVPSAADLAAVTVSFLEIIDSDRDELIERYHVERGVGSWDSLVDFRYPDSQIMSAGAYTNVGSVHADPELFWIYCGPGGPRMSSELHSVLIKTKLGKKVEMFDPWIAVQPKLGSIYMATLADAIADNNMMSPVTDDVRIHQAIGALDRLGELLLGKGSRTNQVGDPESAYLHLALSAVIEPTRLADLPVSQLVKFRSQHQAELSAFRDHVSGLATELQTVAATENPEVARAHLQSIYNKTTKRQLNELRKALRGMGVESTAGTLALKIDLGAASGTVLGSAVGGAAVAGGSLMLGGAAVALAVVPYVAGRLHARRQRRSGSPVAYLLAADRSLTGRSLLRRH